MMNLIPPEGHSLLKHEYALRVGATLAFLFGVVFILLTVALVPTYVLVAAQIKSFALEAQREEGKTSFDEADKDVRATTGVLERLKAAAPTRSASAVIEEVETQAALGIQFKTFYVTDSQGVIDNIQVQGVAPTREALAAFKSSLEDSDMFERADVPIADLARDSDLPFAITVTLVKP